MRGPLGILHKGVSELVMNMRKVGAHGTRLNVQVGGHLRGRQSGRRQMVDLAFTRGEGGQ